MEDFELGSPSASSARHQQAHEEVGPSAGAAARNRSSRTHTSASVRDARPWERETPRLDNRSSAATTTTSAKTSHHSHRETTTTSTATELLPETPAMDVVEKQRDHLQQWARQLRTAVLSWVKAQRKQQEKDHSVLERQLHDELHQQQETIDRLEAVVESQQSFLQKFLVASSGNKSQQPHSPAPRPIIHDGSAAHHGPIRESLMPTNDSASPWHRIGRQLDRNPRSQEIFRKRLGPIATNVNVATVAAPTPSVRGSRPAAGESPAKRLDCSSFRHHETLSDGTRITVYGNGARKEQRPDGGVIIQFANGDVQAVNRAGSSTAYWFADTQVVKLVETGPETSSSSDGSAVYMFPNGQVERHYPDGRKFVQFPNNTTRWVVS